MSDVAFYYQKELNDLFGGTHIRSVMLGNKRHVSLIEIVAGVEGTSTKAASDKFNYLHKKYVQEFNYIKYFKFPGERQRDTPVGDANFVLKLVGLLSGPRAAAFRDAESQQLKRYLGGDLTLIPEIESIRAGQTRLNPEHPLRMFGESVEQEHPMEPLEVPKTLQEVRHLKESGSIVVALIDIIMLAEGGISAMEADRKLEAFQHADPNMFHTMRLHVFPGSTQQTPVAKVYLVLKVLNLLQSPASKAFHEKYGKELSEWMRCSGVHPIPPLQQTYNDMENDGKEEEKDVRAIEGEIMTSSSTGEAVILTEKHKRVTQKLVLHQKREKELAVERLETMKTHTKQRLEEVMFDVQKRQIYKNAEEQSKVDETLLKNQLQQQLESNIVLQKRKQEGQLQVDDIVRKRKLDIELYHLNADSVISGTLKKQKYDQESVLEKQKHDHESVLEKQKFEHVSVLEQQKHEHRAILEKEKSQVEQERLQQESIFQKEKSVLELRLLEIQGVIQQKKLESEVQQIEQLARLESKTNELKELELEKKISEAKLPDIKLPPLLPPLAVPVEDGPWFTVVDYIHIMVVERYQGFRAQLLDKKLLVGQKAAELFRQALHREPKKGKGIMMDGVMRYVNVYCPPEWPYMDQAIKFYFP